MRNTETEQKVNVLTEKRKIISHFRFFSWKRNNLKNFRCIKMKNERKHNKWKQAFSKKHADYWLRHCTFIIINFLYYNVCHSYVFDLFQDDIEIDLDEVLDLEDDAERRTYISVSTGWSEANWGFSNRPRI